MSTQASPSSDSPVVREKGTCGDPGALPRLSFLTPAYRTEEYLPATIASVLAQTVPGWELVVVDNGNSDVVVAVVESFDDPRIRLVRQENRGYTGGVMAAAAAARGAYFCVLDSDDQLMPEFTRTVLDHLDAHPDVDAIGCDAHLFMDGDDQTYGRGYLHSIDAATPHGGGDVLTVEDVLGGRVPYYTAAIRADAWRAVGGYEPGVAGVDESVLIWLRLVSDFEVHLLPDKLARYRVRAESLSRNPEKVEDFERNLIRTFEIFGQNSTNPGQAQLVGVPLRRLRYHQALRRARYAFADGDVPTARQFAREALSQQHTLRARGIVLLMRLPPWLLARVYPVKQWVEQRLRRVLS